MDRILVQPSEIPTDTMFLATNKNIMIALGYLAQAAVGTSTAVDGFACTATSPASLAVLLSTGSIYSVQNVDSVAYGTMGTDTADQIIKQGILLGNTTLSCPAPPTSGQSINYLIQVAFSETDTNAQNIEFYNSANPASPLTNNINTLRQATCLLSAKAGAAATTGTQTTPAPDAGYTGLYVVTVANGQSTITSGNITQLSTAPFINPKLTALPAYLQSGSATYAVDTSGSANTIVASLSPAISALTAGMQFRIKVANTSTGPVVMNLNGLGNTAVYDSKGLQVVAGGVAANRIYTFSYDGSHFVMQSPGSANNVLGAGFKNLKVVHTSNTLGSITADSLVVSDGSGNTYKLNSVFETYQTSVSGSGGLDTGSLAASTWYYEYIIYSPAGSTVNSLFSLSATAPTLPSGYTAFARVGAFLTDGGSNILWKIQYGRDAQYIVGTNPTTTRVMATGAAGNVSTPTYVTVSVSNFVPPTAGKIKLGLEVSGGGQVQAITCPNPNYGNYTSANVFLAASNPASYSSTGGGIIGEMNLESSNVYYASNNPGGGSSLQCLGWTDNL